MTRSHRLSLTSIVTLFLIGACASTEDPGEQPRPPPIGETDCVETCSADGHAVVNCRGEVVSSCSAYASCFDAKCVPGCEAASAAQSSVGCEYYAAKPSADTIFPGGYDANCYAVLIANTWDAPVELEVEYDGRPISSSYFRIPRGRGKDIRYELLPEGKLPRDELAVLFLAMQPQPPMGAGLNYGPCPAAVGAAIVDQTEVRGSGVGKMFHIRSSAPVIAYDIYPYGGADTFLPSSSLLLPTSAWGTQSLAMDGYATTDEGLIDQGFWPYFQVLAKEDNTHIKITPTTTLSSAAGRPQVKPGETGEFELQRGQFLQFTQIQEVNGTAVESDKPVSLVGGSTCINIPNKFAACDTIHQHLPPVRLLGDAYVATRYRDREGPAEPEQTPWRVLAVADGTRLTYDPPIADAPATLEHGQWKEFWAPGPFVVRSQDKNHPIYVASYMTGGQNVSSNDGDPEMVNVVPIGQYLSAYVFLTDPTYGNTNLVFVRGLVDGKYEDVSLDCVGTIE
ncbi:MAG: hypothetical protein K0S65_5426, partial [Labilithrix sp.]|nr:hypothetical protein [Labilithrix sp.]